MAEAGADDLAEVFDNAPRTATLQLHNQRVHPVPMEPSVVLADHQLWT